VGGLVLLFGVAGSLAASNHASANPTPSSPVSPFLDFVKVCSVVVEIASPFDRFPVIV